jgi:hypothetical protein
MARPEFSSDGDRWVEIDDESDILDPEEGDQLSPIEEMVGDQLDDLGEMYAPEPDDPDED